MEGFLRATLLHAKNHDVLREAEAWSVERLQLQFSDNRRGDGVVILHLVRDGERTEPQFEEVEDFAVSGSYPDGSCGLRILDVSHLQWKGIEIRVDAAGGRMGFRSRAVSVEEAPKRRSLTRRGRAK